MPGDKSGSGEGRKDFVTEVGEVQEIKDMNKPVPRREDYASGNEPYEIGSGVVRGPGATRPSLSTGLRTDVIHSTHKTGIRRAPSIGVGKVERSVIRPPDRSKQKQIADLASAVHDSKAHDPYYWGPEETEVKEVEGEKPRQPSQVQAEDVKPTVDSQPNLENLSPEIQLQALVDRYVINSKDPEIKAGLKRTGVEGSYKLDLSFKNDKGDWVVDSQRAITGKIKPILRMLEARLKENGDKQNK